MADEFPRAFRQCFENPRKFLLIQHARDCNTHCAVSRSHSFFIQRATKLRSKHCESHYSYRAQPQPWSTQHHTSRPAERRLERISYRPNTARFSRAQQRAQDLRKHMGVLMAVDVHQRDAARLDLAYLRFHFPLDFFHSNLLADCGNCELLQAAAKAWRVTCQRAQILCERHSINQYDVTSSLEAGLCHGQIDCGIRSPGIGHERGRSYNAGSIALNDRAVDARGQAKIICVNDETTHWVSLTKTIHHKGHKGTRRRGADLLKTGLVEGQKCEKEVPIHSTNKEEYLCAPSCPLWLRSTVVKIYAVFTSCGRGCLSPRNILIFSRSAGKRSSFCRHAETSLPPSIGP